MVVVAKIAGDTERFLLGSREIAGDSDLDVFSEKSPLGAAIVGHKRAGESVSYTAPNGKDITVEIISAKPLRRADKRTDSTPKAGSCGNPPSASARSRAGAGVGNPNASVESGPAAVAAARRRRRRRPPRQGAPARRRSRPRRRQDAEEDAAVGNEEHHGQQDLPPAAVEEAAHQQEREEPEDQPGRADRRAVHPISHTASPEASQLEASAMRNTPDPVQQHQEPETISGSVLDNRWPGWRAAAGRVRTSEPIQPPRRDPPAAG